MVFAIILAGGSGSRMNSALPKQRMLLLGKTVIYRSVLAFEECSDVDRIIVVCREDELEYMKCELREMKKVYKIVSGGKNRAESSYKGLCAVDCECELVAIHDAARCLITPIGISRLIEKARLCGAATAATAVSDSIKRIDTEGNIAQTLNRSELVAVQTPQVFDYSRLYSAFCDTDLADNGITDDNMIYEKTGHPIQTVDIGCENIKITTPRDLIFAELIIKERECRE